MQNNRTNDKKHENQKKNLYYVLEKKKAMYEVAISKFWVNILYKIIYADRFSILLLFVFL